MSLARAKSSFAVNKAFQNLLKGQNSEVLRETLTLAIRDELFGWHADTLPRHFEPAAYQRYRRGAYIRRTFRYEFGSRTAFERVRAGLGQRKHPDPMVHSGAMRDALLDTRPTVERRRGKSGKVLRVTARLPFVRVANIWSGNRYPGHDFPRSLTATNQKEINAMAVSIRARHKVYLRRALSNPAMARTRMTA